ncbi:MAG: hypothetical protein AB1305_04725, partial [Candidatus Hadarchaeota archaeon]
MKISTKIKKSFGLWAPKENLVYFPKIVITRSKALVDKYIAVIININNENYLGTFRVKDNFCEIRSTKLNAIIPLNMLKLSKRQKYYGLTEQGSQKHLDVI